MGANRERELETEELARTSAYKWKLLANMSHELRSPLNAIIGFSEIMHDESVALDPATTREYLGDILRSGRRLLQLINQVLDVAHAEAGKLELHLPPGAVAGLAVRDALAKPLSEPALLSSLRQAGVTPERGRSIILVVDGDPASLGVMSATLDRLGYLAVCEDDPGRALAAASEEPPSAIVLDLIMPRMSGFEFLDQLRAVPSGKSVPVIVWTSKELTADERARLRQFEPVAAVPR